MRLNEFASMGATSSGGIATVAAPQNKDPIRRDGKVTEMFSTGAAGFQVFNVNSRVYESLMGYFPDAHSDFDPKEGTARVFFDEGVTDEIDAKMDRFNSNWQTKSMAIEK